MSNKLISIFGQILNIFFLLLINRFFYQEFGLFFLGIYNAAVILTQFILIFSDFGITAGLTYEISRQRLSNLNYVTKLAQTGFFISILLFIFFVFILEYILKHPIILSHLNVKNFDNYFIIYCLIIGLLVAIPRNFLGSIFMGFNLPHILSFLNLFSNFINLLGLVIVLYLGFNDFTIGYIFIGTNVFSFLIFIICIIRYVNYNILILKFNLKILQKIILYSSKIYIGSLVSFFSSFIDRILVFTLISTSSLGIYSIIHNISQKIEIVGSSVATAIFPELVSTVKKSKKQFILHSNNWLEFTNFSTLNAGIFIYFASDYVYYFIFSKFPNFEIKIIFLIVVFAYIIKSICNLSIWIISSFNKPQIQIYYGVISLISYLIIILLFLNNLNIETIAFAFLFSNFISFLFLFKFLKRILNKNYFLDIYKKFTIIFFSSIIYLLCSYLLFFYFSKSFFVGLYTYLSYILFLWLIFFKTNLLSNYKNNKIIKFILMKLNNLCFQK